MTASQVRASFDFKGTSLPLTAVVLKTTDLITLASDLENRMAETPDFFDQDPVLIDLSLVRAEEGPVNFDALIAVLRNHHMVPVAARGGSEAQMLAATTAGLGRAADAPSRGDTTLTLGPRTADRPVAHASTAASPTSSAAAAGEVPTNRADTPLEAASDDSDALDSDALPTLTRADAIAPLEGNVAPAPEPVIEIREVVHEIIREIEVPVGAVPALVVDKPLRSGQQVYARNADLVVLAAVSFGAEVMADGNVHVYGPLRGRALAGVQGNTEARIFTTCLEPQLISIAGIYRTTEVPIPDDVAGKPAQVRLVGEKIVIDPL